VQYFQRAKFEYHPENQGGPGEVQLAHLGRQLLNLDPRAEQLRQPVRAIQLLGEATTSYAASIRERRHNIARATDLFNGTIVPPDTEFSFNSVSDFSTASGFVEGYAIIGGRLELVVAGGLCQVSTTMFRAVSNAGLKITHRQGHTFIVNFYENILGFDATVYDPDVDFRWYNDTPGPVYIAAQSNPEASTVTFWLWGYDDGRTVSYEGPYTSNWTQPGPAIWEYDPTMPAGAVRQLVHGRSGTDVVYIRTVTMPDGRVLHHDRFFTHYEPWADFYVYGPGGRN
jgi:vancomycin resistance protein YoaR